MVEFSCPHHVFKESHLFSLASVGIRERKLGVYIVSLLCFVSARICLSSSCLPSWAGELQGELPRDLIFWLELE